jgi:hypothetical protein
MLECECRHIEGRLLPTSGLIALGKRSLVLFFSGESIGLLFVAVESMCLEEFLSLLHNWYA